MSSAKCDTIEHGVSREYLFVSENTYMEYHIMRLRQLSFVFVVCYMHNRPKYFRDDIELHNLLTRIRNQG